MSTEQAIAELRRIDDNHDYREWQTSATVAAALLQHADQERIAKALEDLLEPLCTIANAITSYEGRR